jgi:Cadherin-like domain
VTNNGDETLTYTPDPDFNGVDAFTYAVSDGTGEPVVATVTITVAPVNHPTVDRQVLLGCAIIVFPPKATLTPVRVHARFANAPDTGVECHALGGSPRRLCFRPRLGARARPSPGVPRLRSRLVGQRSSAPTLPA